MSPTTIALLPFENLSGEADQEILARGISLDLAVELARFPHIEVIPPASASQVLSMAAGAWRSSPMLALSGGVRRWQDRVRIAVSLTDVATGAQLWGERYDPEPQALLDVQAAIAGHVAGALAGRADEARLALARRKPLASLEVYECWLRGRDCLQRGTIESDAEARRFFQRALEIDPHFARAHAGLSLSHFNEWSCQAWLRWDETERLAYMHARRAEELDRTDAMVEIVLGRILLYRRRFDEAAHRVGRALALNPNDADVLAHAALCRAYLGEGGSGVELARKAARLNPVSGEWYITPLALSLLVCGRYDEAVAWGVRNPHATLDCPGLLAAALAHAGDLARAGEYLQTFLEQFQERVLFGRAPEPGEALRWLLHVNPFRRAEDIARIADGLERAGLPADPDLSSPARRLVPTSPERAEENVCRFDGRRWTLAFEGVAVELSDAKGLHDLAVLLTSPGEEHHCLELSGRAPDTGPRDEIIDERARREYRARIQELQREIDEADRDHDPARAGRAREELDALVEAISGALGLGGRPRALGSASERARSAVTWRIRSAIKKIAQLHPSLGRHLDNSIRTGTYCSYVPERPLRWSD